MDVDIPVAHARYVDTVIPEPVQERPEMARGRSARVALPKDQSYKLNESDIRALQQQGFTRGLAETLTRNNIAFPLRVWVVDNSGSMTIRDGHRIIESSQKDKVKLVDCTRWSEIQQTVEYHVQMAALLQAPTVFRLLNDPGRVSGPQQFSVGEKGENMIDHDVATALQTIRNSSPGGVTPLSEHLREIRSNVLAIESSLRDEGSKVAIILATDGLPTDFRGSCDAHTKREFTETLRSLEGLPVWIVVRLCTDDDEVVNFYNTLDENLELSLEVIDDFVQEAEEVNSHNSWLNYALPLHRCREMGYHNKLFDLLDERQLSPDELRDFLLLLFGAGKFDGVPDPQADWDGFVKMIKPIVEKENLQWNPISKRMCPWVDIKKLNKTYKTGCSIM